MTTYHVTLEAAGDDGPSPAVGDLDDLLVLLGPDATVLGDSERHAHRYGAEISVEADSAFSAISAARRTFAAAVRQTALPRWPVVRVAAITDDELDAELARPAFPQLVGIREIAELLGVTPQRASTLCRSDAFPVPVAELRAGPVWTATSVRRFLEEWKRQPGRPPLKKASA